MHDDKYWGDVYASLFYIARKWGWTEERAKEMAQRTVVKACEEVGGVDSTARRATAPAVSRGVHGPVAMREDRRALVVRMSGIMRQDAFNEDRARKRRETSSWRNAVAQAKSAFGLSPGREASAKERADLLVNALLERTKDDKECHDLLLQVIDGNDDPAEQARETGMSRSTLKNAQKRLNRLRDEIAARYGGRQAFIEVDPTSDGTNDGELES